MKNLRFIAGMGLGAVLATGGMLVAQGAHPRLRIAQDLVDQAFNKVSEAQRYNEFDMGGHAQRAKELLKQASHEIALAGQWAQ